MMALRTVTLDQCCTIVSGATPKTSVQEYWDGEIFWTTPKDLSNLETHYLADTPRKITQLGLASCGASVLPSGSVLFSSRAPIGHVAINAVPMATNQGFKSFIPKAGILDAKFLFHWLRKNRAYLESLGNGATFKEVSKATVSRIEINLPPIADQRRIAAILDQADALRAKRREALAQLESLTQSIFIEMFGDPATNSMGWPDTQLKNILSMPLRNGLSPSNSGTVFAKVLTLSAITGNEFDAHAWKKSTFQSTPPTHQSVNELDFLICRGNGNVCLVGKGYFPTSSMVDVTFPDTMIAARLSTECIAREYLQHLWHTSALRHQIEASARTTNGTFKVNQTMLEELTFMLPPLLNQQKFGIKIQTVEALKANHRTSLTELDTLFASLQHRAFQGEL